MSKYKKEYERPRLGIESEGKRYNSVISSERLPSGLSVFTSLWEYLSKRKYPKLPEYPISIETVTVGILHSEMSITCRFFCSVFFRWRTKLAEFTVFVRALSYCYFRYEIVANSLATFLFGVLGVWGRSMVAMGLQFCGVQGC